MERRELARLRHMAREQAESTEQPATGKEDGGKGNAFSNYIIMSSNNHNIHCMI